MTEVLQFEDVYVTNCYKLVYTEHVKTLREILSKVCILLPVHEEYLECAPLLAPNASFEAI